MWTEKAFDIQQRYLNRNSKGLTKVDMQKSGEITTTLSNELNRIRALIGDRLHSTKGPVSKFLSRLPSGKVQRSHQDMFYQEMRAISLLCTEEMVGFCKKVFAQSIKALTPRCPPCAFCVVALGSLARGEMTPYSDLEYIILIKKRDRKIEEYFEDFAMTSYFIIGNLRETTLRTMAISELQDWFDDRQTNRFKIDGPAEWAGNIPTG